ncbi:MAG TPA: hypothetical protein DD440_05455 [Porticoccaceae bacterium]|nr:hypothetical protein [Porticoccaceae bacterium]
MFFKDSAKKKALMAAKSAYTEAAMMKGDTREEVAFRRRIGFRSRTHLDKVFIEGATRTARYHDQCLRATAQGLETPAAPKPSTFQVAKGPNGEIYTYVPIEFATDVFVLGGQYQTMEIDAFSAIRQTQAVADKLSLDLDLEKPIVTLQFLRDELEAASEDEADSDGDAV